MTSSHSQLLKQLLLLMIQVMRVQMSIFCLVPCGKLSWLLIISLFLIVSYRVTCAVVGYQTTLICNVYRTVRHYRVARGHHL